MSVNAVYRRVGDCLQAVVNLLHYADSVAASECGDFVGKICHRGTHGDVVHYFEGLRFGIVGEIDNPVVALSANRRFVVYAGVVGTGHRVAVRTAFAGVVVAHVIGVVIRIADLYRHSVKQLVAFLFDDIRIAVVAAVLHHLSENGEVVVGHTQQDVRHKTVAAVRRGVSVIISRSERVGERGFVGRVVAERLLVLCHEGFETREDFVVGHGRGRTYHSFELGDEQGFQLVLIIVFVARVQRIEVVCDVLNRGIEILFEIFRLFRRGIGRQTVELHFTARDERAVSVGEASVFIQRTGRPLRLGEVVIGVVIRVGVLRRLFTHGTGLGVFHPLRIKRRAFGEHGGEIEFVAVRARRVGIPAVERIAVVCGVVGLESGGAALYALTVDGAAALRVEAHGDGVAARVFLILVRGAGTVRRRIVAEVDEAFERGIDGRKQIVVDVLYRTVQFAAGKQVGNVGRRRGAASAVLFVEPSHKFVLGKQHEQFALGEGLQQIVRRRLVGQTVVIVIDVSVRVEAD